jgi:hypothetical protein
MWQAMSDDKSRGKGQDHHHGHGRPHGQDLTGGAFIADPDTIVAGRTITDWAAKWTTWGLQAPADSNPLTDTTGQFAGTDNGGKIFFIAGPINATADTPPSERTFNVPLGKTLMIPVITVFATEGKGIPASKPEFGTHYRAEVNSELQDWDNNSSLFASVDGQAIHNLRDYRVETDFFPMGNVKSSSLLENFGVPAGTPTDNTKAEGYWLMLENLPKGTHTLDFGGSFSGGFLSAYPHTIDRIAVA